MRSGRSSRRRSFLMSTLDEQIEQRRHHLIELGRLGIDVYPRRFDRRHTISELIERYGSRTREALDAESIETSTGGRVLAMRTFGKANFLVISDGIAKVQVY